MTALIILGMIIAVIVFFLLLRVGVTAQYSEDGFEVLINAGFFSKKIVPRAKKEKKEKKPRKEKKPKKAEEAPKKGGTLKQIKELLPIISDSLGRLKRKLTINTLTVYYMAAGEDPARVAMSFGAASFVAGMFLPILENNFRIKNKDIRTAASFTEPESYVYVNARLSVAIGSIIYLAIIFGYKYLRAKKDEQDTDK